MAQINQQPASHRSYSSSERTKSAHSILAVSILSFEIFEGWDAPSLETFACFLYKVASTTVIASVKNDIPSDFKHMFKETRNDIGIVSFLLKIHDKLEVCTVFGLVRCSCERDINMITSDPLIEVIFNLKVVLGRSEIECNYKEKTYHCQYKCNGNHWKWVVLRKFRKYNAVVLFILEPDLIDNGLYQRGTKYARFRIRILDIVNHQQQ